MDLSKVNYSQGTIISAENLNAIQDNIITYCVPNYTSSNDGQFLRIVGGKMQWVTIASAEDLSL